MKRPQGLDPAPPDAGRTPQEARGPARGRERAGRPVPPARRGRDRAAAASDAGAAAGLRASGAAEPGVAEPGTAQPGTDGGAAPPLTLRAARSALRTARRARRARQRGRARRFGRRSRRMRRAVIACWVLAALVPAGAAAFALSPANALRHLVVQGAQPQVAAQIRSAVSGELGRPLALVDKAAVGDELAGIARVERYQLTLQPPATMVVTVVERTPIAAVRQGSGYAVVDPAGVVLETAAVAPAYPLVAGGRHGAGFAAAVRVLAALPDSVRTRIAEVSAGTGGDVTFLLRGTAKARVVWGDDTQPALKARVLTALLAAVPHAKKYDVSAPDNAVTR